ncbi:MAG: YfhO family protein [Bacteroidota bacterium]
MIKRNYFLDYLILLFILFAGMFPLFCGFAVMKWDIMDIYLPWKYFITEALKNGVLPLWNPFMNCGFAQQGDPGTWYPVSWLIGLVFQKYNITAVHLEYLLHLYIASIGMYLFGILKKFSRTARLILAVSYMFSGFFISNAQHLGWLVSAAWFPYVIYYFSLLQKKQDFTLSLKFAFVLFLMLSGGYPGIFISTIYILLVYYLFFVGRVLKERKYKEFQKFSKGLLISVIAFLVFSAVILISSFELAQHITRGNGLGYDNFGGILTGSLPIKALVSLIYPFAVGFKDTTYWGADFALINIYFGIGILILLIFINFQKNVQKNVRIYTFAGIFFLMIAMPQIFPLRKLLMFLPYMDMFRFSSLFRIYAIFFFLIASGYAIDKIILNRQVRLEYFRFLLYVIPIFTIINGVLLFMMERWKFLKLFTEGWLYFNNIADVDERIFFQGGITIVLLVLLAFFIRQKQLQNTFFKRLVFVVFVLDILISVQLNLYATVVSKFHVKEINKSFEKTPDDYPFPSLKTNMDQITDQKMVHNIPYIWKNMAIYQKKPSSDGVNPYSFTTMDKALKNNNYDALINHPVLFFASRINNNNTVDTNSIDKKSYQNLKIIDFNNNKLKVKVSTDTVKQLVFLQNYYPGWQATIDNQKQPILKVNNTFMAIKIPKGKHKITFNFYPKRVVYAAYISIASWLIFMVFLIGAKVVRKH